MLAALCSRHPHPSDGVRRHSSYSTVSCEHSSVSVVTEWGGASLINTLSLNTPVNDCQETQSPLRTGNKGVTRQRQQGSTRILFIFFKIEVQRLFLQNG